MELMKSDDWDSDHILLCLCEYPRLVLISVYFSRNMIALVALITGPRKIMMTWEMAFL